MINKLSLNILIAFFMIGIGSSAQSKILIHSNDKCYCLRIENNEYKLAYSEKLSKYIFSVTSMLSGHVFSIMPLSLGSFFIDKDTLYLHDYTLNFKMQFVTNNNYIIPIISFPFLTTSMKFTECPIDSHTTFNLKLFNGKCVKYKTNITDVQGVYSSIDDSNYYKQGFWLTLFDSTYSYYYQNQLLSTGSFYAKNSTVNFIDDVLQGVFSLKVLEENVLWADSLIGTIPKPIYFYKQKW